MGCWCKLAPQNSKMMNNGSRFNQDFLDAISILSFMIGIMNLDENLSQSDKDDMMHQLDEKTNKMLKRIEDDLEEQNEMLREILSRLERLEESDVRS